MTETKTTEKLRELAIQAAIGLFEGGEMDNNRAGSRHPHGLMSPPKGIEKVRSLIGPLEHGVIEPLQARLVHVKCPLKNKWALS